MELRCVVNGRIIVIDNEIEETREACVVSDALEDLSESVVVKLLDWDILDE